MENKTIRALWVVVWAGLFVSTLHSDAERVEPPVSPSQQEYLRIADEVEANLQNQVLEKFFPAAADESGGGFFENYGLDWTRLPGTAKSIVYQSRLTWTSAQAAQRFPARADMYLAMTRRGVALLMNKMWDKEGGGFYWTFNGHGLTTNAPKQMYGHAFGIYALAGSYRATKDAATLEMAKRAFSWMEAHAHDSSHGGYFENIGPDGKPTDPVGGNAVGAAAGQKSMNTSIHVLEALTELYQVWPDALVKQRVQEMWDTCRARIYSEPGYLTQFLSADWQRTPSPDSFGHDVETAFLMVEAAEALGQGNDSRTWLAARHLVDHALQCGWDNARGGLYDSAVINLEGVVTGEADTRKIWWVQAEHLNALLLLHERFGQETSRYWNAFLKEWEWIRKSQVDPVHGGWWATVRADGTPISRVKADMWTECYHQGRAMLRVSDRLRRLTARSDQPSTPR
jgi:cellobiose epimerase